MTVRSYFRKLRGQDYAADHLEISWYIRTENPNAPWFRIWLCNFGDYDRVVEELIYQPLLHTLEVDENLPYNPLVRTYYLPVRRMFLPSFKITE